MRNDVGYLHIRLPALREAIASIRARGGELDPDELNTLIEEARTEFCKVRRQMAANASSAEAQGDPGRQQPD